MDKKGFLSAVRRYLLFKRTSRNMRNTVENLFFFFFFAAAMHERRSTNRVQSQPRARLFSQSSAYLQIHHLDGIL